jgi:sulfite exporter TauE/SafE
MYRIVRNSIIEFTGIMLIVLALLLLSFSTSFKLSFDIPPSSLVQTRCLEPVGIDPDPMRMILGQANFG